MAFLKFIDGRLTGLNMSAEGAPGDGGAPGGSGGVPGVLTFDSSKPFGDQLPEQYRADASFRDIKNFDGLLSQFVNQKKMLGDRGSYVALPKDGDEAGANEFYSKLGRPEAWDKYEIGKRADGSDYSDVDKAFHKELLPTLHKAGLTQKQLDAIRPAWDAVQAKALENSTVQAKAYAQEQLGGLQKEWGTDFDKNVTDAAAAIQHLGGKELAAELNIVKDGKATGDNAQLIRVFAKIGAQLREDGVLKGESPPGDGMGVDQAKQQIQKLEGDPEFKKIYLQKDSIGKYDGKDLTHAQAVEMMRGLYAAAYPSAA
jgi:hypothetical protein